MLRYLREELGYKSDLFYQGPFGGGYPPPTAFRGDWMSVRWNRNPPAAAGRGGGATPAPPAGLAAALAADPDLRVFHACGYFDMAIACHASDYAARRVAPALAPRVSSRVYAGGHATYTDDAARRLLRDDVVRFIQGGGADRLRRHRRAALGGVADGRAAQQSAVFQEPQLATSRQQIRINGSPLSYTARIGLMPIRHNDTGEVRGHFGFVWYSLDRAAGAAARPLIFLWNGGPGANSTTVHFTGFGPRRLRSPDDPARPAPVVAELYDNDATWLTFADLVFVDPVGTGFARPATPEFAAEFYNTLGDLASTAEFIRTFRTRFDLLTSPFFLAGESYGTWRAAGAAELLEKTGVRPAGVILISGGLAMGPAAPDAIRTALYVPARTATAFYHKALAPELLKDEPAAIDGSAEVGARRLRARVGEARRHSSDAERDRIVAGTREVHRRPGGQHRSRDARHDVAAVHVHAVERSWRHARPLRHAHPAGRRAWRCVARVPAMAPREARFCCGTCGDLGFKTDLTYQGLETGWSAAPGGRARRPGLALGVESGRGGARERDRCGAAARIAPPSAPATARPAAVSPGCGARWRSIRD